MGHLNFDALVFKHFMCQLLKLFPSNAMARTSAPIHILGKRVEFLARSLL